ncbi:Trypsin-like peptidase domain-containing protein [Lutimaribacter pacificus]|uniref:Trypsin-like peptidase domain-containing protein n=1 Tax=Lutimaribacter pacificus TaxID=391948 RepID=A0A1H0IWC5_9RHOB|nr:serine protease [Lutimaribacter pacificus]SDO35520.1 Trypsin-like peptidase domain-containing protein [Lutimaribacter pacificus]SHK16995.1 Trypsin-like peptidase domain-containing protein [Lutimaribacter pacificus]
MAEHFLTKSQIELGQCLETGSGLALESHAALERILADRVSPEAAALFAEPLINRGNDEAPASIAWYTDLPGDGRPLSDLGDSERSRVEAILTEQLRAIREVLNDPEDGPLVGAALHLAGTPKGDVWVVNGRPVLINWAMMPAGAGHDSAARARAFAASLGRYLPLSAAPPVTAQDVAARRSATAAASEPATSAPAPEADKPAAAVPPPGAVPPPPPAREPRRHGLMSWLPLVLLLLIAAGTLFWLLSPGTRIFAQADPDAAISAVEAADAVAEINAALTARRDMLQAALDGAQCRADGTLLMPDGMTIEGLLPINPDNPNDGPGKKAQAAPTSILPPDPARVQVPQSGSIDTAALLDLIEERTVRVVARLSGGAASTGTGFFIAPDFVVTNFHVVSDPRITEVFVINERIARPLDAQVVSVSGPIGENGDDFALLRVPEGKQPFFRILNTDSSLKLRSVIAAGFPGDMDFAAGNPDGLTRPPTMTLTDGTVSNEQTLQVTPGGAFRAIAHSAPISQGNSGGPLVDMCGRVVGVNTFVRAGMLRTVNFALSARDLLDFLAATPTAPDVVTQPCSPEMLRPATRSAETAAPAQTAPALPDFGLSPGTE